MCETDEPEADADELEATLAFGLVAELAPSVDMPDSEDVVTANFLGGSRTLCKRPFGPSSRSGSQLELFGLGERDEAASCSAKVELDSGKDPASVTMVPSLILGEADEEGTVFGSEENPRLLHLSGCTCPGGEKSTSK